MVGQQEEIYNSLKHNMGLDPWVDLGTSLPYF